MSLTSHPILPTKPHSNWDIYLLLCRIVTNRATSVELALLNTYNNWESLVNVASSQLIITSVAWHLLNNKDLWCIVPKDLQAYLQLLHDQNSQRNQSIKQHAIKTIKLLNDAGITPMPIKGALNLLTGLYPSDGYRLMSDIDLIAPTQQVEKAYQCLLEAGFVPATNAPDQKQFLKLAKTNEEYELLYQKYLAICHHLPPLVMENSPASIEIHQSPHANYIQSGLGSDQLIQAGLTVATPCQFVIPKLDSRLGLLFFNGHIQNRLHNKYSFSLRYALDRYWLSTLSDEDTAQPAVEITSANQYKKHHKNYERLYHYFFQQNPIHTSSTTIIQKIYLRTLRTTFSNTPIAGFLRFFLKIKTYCVMTAENPKVAARAIFNRKKRQRHLKALFCEH